MTTTEQVEHAMLELGPLARIPVHVYDRDEWNTRFAGRIHGYVMPRPIGAAWTPLHFCPDILVEQASSFVGTNTEAELLRRTDADDPTADAIGIYVGALRNLVLFEVANGDEEDDVERRLLAESEMWKVAAEDLEFFKRVQVRATMRLVSA